MLVQVSALSPDSAEEVDMSVFVASEAERHDPSSAWSGQSLRLRGLLRDGTGFAVGLSLTECAQLYLTLRDDRSVRGWAEMMEARTSDSIDLPLDEPAIAAP